MVIEKSCSKCSGMGKVRCPSCGGTGHGSAFSHSPFCSTCGGQSQVGCNQCGGRGKVRDYDAERRSIKAQKDSAQQQGTGSANIDSNGCLVVTIALLSPFILGGMYWIT